MQLVIFEEYLFLFRFVFIKKKEFRFCWNSCGFLLSDRRGSNPRPAAWEAAALPTELLSQKAHH